MYPIVEVAQLHKWFREAGIGKCSDGIAAVYFCDAFRYQSISVTLHFQRCLSISESTQDCVLKLTINSNAAAVGVFLRRSDDQLDEGLYDF